MIANDRRARPTCQKAKRSQGLDPQAVDVPVQAVEDQTDGPSKDDPSKDAAPKDAPAASAKELDVESAQPQPAVSETHIWEISDGESSLGLSCKTPTLACERLPFGLELGTRSEFGAVS